TLSLSLWWLHATDQFGVRVCSIAAVRVRSTPCDTTSRATVIAVRCDRSNLLDGNGSGVIIQGIGIDRCHNAAIRQERTEKLINTPNHLDLCQFLTIGSTSIDSHTFV